MRTHALVDCCCRTSRAFLFIGSLACCGFAGAANVISLQGDGGLLPNTPNQQVTLLLSSSDFYIATDAWFKINGGIGPAPRIHAVFGDTGSGISPNSLLDGSVWEGGDGGISITSGEGTYPGSGPNRAASGLNLFAAFATPTFTPQNTDGVFAVLTVSTVNVPSGSYALSLDRTILYKWTGEDPEPIAPLPLQLPDISLSVGIGAFPNPATQISLNNALAPSTPAELSGAVQISNSGFLASELTVESALISGPDAALFEVLGGFSPLQLLAGEDELDVGFRFLGAAPGTYTAQVTFSFSDGPPLTYPLAVTVVPEPSTYALAASGAVALVAVWRRRVLPSLN